MDAKDRSHDGEDSTVAPGVQAAHDSDAAPGTDSALVRGAEQVHPPSAISDAVPYVTPADKRFIVTCPGCGGSGRVLRDGSQVRLSCRLCWERGVVARIVADRYLRDARSAPGAYRAGMH